MLTASPHTAVAALALILAGLVLAISPLVGNPDRAWAAASAEELRQRVAAAEAEAEELRSKLAAARERMFAAEAEANEAQARLDQVEAKLAEGRARRQELARESRLAGQRLKRERGRLRRARQVLAERLVAIYFAGPAAGDDVLIEAQDYGDFLVGSQYMAAIESADQKLASRVEAVRAAVAAELEKLRRSHAVAKRHENELAAARAEVGEVAAAAQARAAELRSAAAARDAALRELTAKLDRWTQEVKKAERREARQAGSASETVERWLGGPYSIPTAIVMCESGGNYSALNPSSGAGGAYQIMPSTWAAYGGKGLPHQAPKAEQDRIAALIWADSGPSAWVCKG